MKAPKKFLSVSLGFNRLGQRTVSWYEDPDGDQRTAIVSRFWDAVISEAEHHAQEKVLRGIRNSLGLGDRL